MDDDLKDQIESLLAIPNESMSTPVPWLARELLRRSLSALRQRDEALEPFAKAFATLSSRWLDHEDHWQEALPRPLTVGDLRRARAILTGSETNAR